MPTTLPANLSILAIDTAMDRCSVALLQSGTVIEKTVDAPREHTQRILPMVSTLLQESHANLSDLDAIAISNGPGSFTGLRIGLSIAQGLAYGADLPLIPISTLHAMALGAARCYGLKAGEIIIPAIDARMDEVYWSAYELSANDAHLTQLLLLAQEQVGKPSDCYHESLALTPSPSALIGSGWRYCSAEQLSLTKQHDIGFSSSAYDVAVLAADAFNRGELSNPIHVEPTYLRNEISWQKRQRIRQ